MLFRDIEVYLYLDWVGLFGLAEKRGIQARWQTKAEKKLLQPMGYFRRMNKLPVFERNDKLHILGDGTVAQILFDGTRVTSIIDLMDEILS